MTELFDGLMLSVVAFVLVFLLVRAWANAEKKRARWRRHIAELDRDEPHACIMEGVGGGRVCRTCGRHVDGREVAS